MIVYETAQFAEWFERLRDREAQHRIRVRIRRFELGNPGDTRGVGTGAHELRIDYGPGYRIYFAKLARDAVVLLCGGIKNTQERDIRLAKELANDL